MYDQADTLCLNEYAVWYKFCKVELILIQALKSCCTIVASGQVLQRLLRTQANGKASACLLA